MPEGALCSVPHSNRAHAPWPPMTDYPRASIPCCCGQRVGPVTTDWSCSEPGSRQEGPVHGLLPAGYELLVDREVGKQREKERIADLDPVTEDVDLPYEEQVDRSCEERRPDGVPPVLVP